MEPIKSNEVMVGNWVNHSNGKPIQINANHILYLNNTKYHGYDPIPLTEAILLKCGFCKERCGISGADMWQGLDYWYIQGGEITLRGNPKNGLKLSGYYNTNIKYLHQLQNLYWCLTQTHLNVQL